MKFGIIIPDVHLPFHSESAWNLVLKVIKTTKPDYVISVGDLADLYSVTRHTKDPGRRELSLVTEAAKVNRELDKLQTAAGKAKVHWVLGNHENRFDRYIAEKAPELFGVTDIQSLFETKARKWSVTAYGDYLQLGKVFFTHDVGTAGANAHRDAEKDFCHSVVIGHTHRMSYDVVGNASDQAHVAAMFGWLGDRKYADYISSIKRKRYWSHGFGSFYLKDNGVMFLTPHPIVKGECMVNGKLFKA